MTTPIKPTMSKAAREVVRVQAARSQRRQRIVWRTAFVVLVAGAVLFAISRTGGGAGHAGTFQVGQPASGVAPPVQLAATDGTRFDLTAQRGKTVLLYFQEGVGCQPCWTQVRDIEHNQSQFDALGINEVVTIAGNPLDALRQKAADEGLHGVVLSDPNLAVSRTYHANEFGMMGSSADGHTFIVVGPDGRIRWRADFGGAPNYTMYVPINQLITDLRAGLSGQ